MFSSGVSHSTQKYSLFQHMTQRLLSSLRSVVSPLQTTKHDWISSVASVLLIYIIRCVCVRNTFIINDWILKHSWGWSLSANISVISVIERKESRLSAKVFVFQTFVKINVFLIYPIWSVCVCSGCGRVSREMGSGVVVEAGLLWALTNQSEEGLRSVWLWSAELLTVNTLLLER